MSAIYHWHAQTSKTRYNPAIKKRQENSYEQANHWQKSTRFHPPRHR